tara:strand:- start:11731 stop:12285 length:555 start_codon:yes stop_codon:yes gene_type:complete
MIIRSLIFLLVFGIIGSLLFKVQKRLMPKRYFYYSRLIDGIEDEISFLGLASRTFIPLFIGLVAVLVETLIPIEMSSLSIGATVGFFSIFLIVWPDFINPELISPHFLKVKWKLFTLYLFLLICFTVFGGIGGLFGQYILTNEFTFLQLFDLKGIFNGIIATALWVIGTYLLKIFAQSFKKDHR